MNNHIIVGETPKEIRTLARMALRGLWKEAFLGMLIWTALMQILPRIIQTFIPFVKYTYSIPEIDYSVTISPLSYIYQIILAGPMAVGLCKFILLIVRRKEVNYSKLFGGFQHFIKALLLQILIGIFVMLWSFPGILASSFVIALAPAFSLFAFGGMTALTIWAYLKYIMAQFYLSDDWSLSPMDCIKLSKESMEGNKGKMFILLFSFFGWTVLISASEMYLRMLFPNATEGMQIVLYLVASIPAIFVSLYMNVAEGFFFELVTGHLRKQGM